MTLRQRPTLEEFLQWPEQKPYLEFIHGLVRAKTVPDAPHSLVQSELIIAIGLWSRATDGFTLTEQRCVLEADGETHTVLPDVAWWSGARLPALPTGPIRIPPVLAVEVLSPNDRYGEVQDKVLVYLEAGVSVVWVVDPMSRNVTVYRAHCTPQVFAPPATLGDPGLPDLCVSLTEVFARLPVPPQPYVSE